MTDRGEATLRPTVLCNLAFWLVLSTSAGGLHAAITRQMHPWGRFEPGAWKVVRVDTVTYDASGSMRSVYEAKTTLSDVSDMDVTLEVERHLDVAGKEFDPPPRWSGKASTANRSARRRRSPTWEPRTGDPGAKNPLQDPAARTRRCKRQDDHKNLLFRDRLRPTFFAARARPLPQTARC